MGQKAHTIKSSKQNGRGLILEPMKLYAYNAGKGDCIRIQIGSHNMFIDTGVMRFGLRFKSICDEIIAAGDSLDLLILTHVDDDHIGGVLLLLRMGWKCPFKEIRMNHIGDEGISNAYLSTAQNDEVYRRLAARGAVVNTMLAGDLIDFAGSQIKTISPEVITEAKFKKNTLLAYQRDYSRSLKSLAEAPISSFDSSISNKNSIIFILTYSGRDYLFTGDAWAQDIISGLGEGMHSFELVKLSHHGAVGNLCDRFASSIQAQNFLICTDGVMHPDKQTIAKLKAWYGCVNIYSTSNWWDKRFFTEEDNANSINLIHKDGLIFE